MNETKQNEVIDKTKHVGEVYESPSYGKYEIIECVTGPIFNPMVKVKFANTNKIVECRYNAAIKGLARDPSHIESMYCGNTYDTCCGPVLVLEYLGYYKKCDFVKIRFLYTGYECEERLKNILKGYANDPNYFMYTVKDKIFHSNNYGDYKIIADEGSGKHNMKMVRIKFLATGYEYVTRYDAARDGSVKDPTYFSHTIKGQIFHTNNYGDIEILDQVGMTEDGKHRIMKIRFITTGFERTAKYDDIVRGEVKDPTLVNFINARNIIGNTPINDLERTIRKSWTNMMNRCYDKSHVGYESYGGKGVIVCKEWHDYNNFRNDVINLPGWALKFNDPVNYQLDKDLLQYTVPHENRVYSKNTCVWLHRSINSAICNYNENFHIIYGCIYEIYNLYYVKTLLDYLPNYGPFDSLESAINMANYCHSYAGLNQFIIPVNNIMTTQQIFEHTKDRRVMVEII